MGESVIKRGVPRNTKPAPAVVAIKMADLLSVQDNEVDQERENTVSAAVESQKHIEKGADDIKSQQLSKQTEDERLQLKKEQQQQEKLRKEEETKAKKEQERLVKLQKKEEEKLEK